ncbi:MAG: hypothetical protein KKG92_07415 [Gammaproteobacteria bacterium]|nr:hypothetical protein [Gammaproteobacteria bacterium]
MGKAQRAQHPAALLGTLRFAQRFYGFNCWILDEAEDVPIFPAERVIDDVLLSALCDQESKLITNPNRKEITTLVKSIPAT